MDAARPQQAERVAQPRGSPPGDVVGLARAPAAKRGDDARHGVVDVGEVARGAGRGVPRHRLARGHRGDPAGERHLGPLARPVDRERAHDHGVAAVAEHRGLGRHLALRVAVQRRERRVLRCGELARVAVDRRARDEHEAGPAGRRGAREPVGELHVRRPELRDRAPRPHAGQRGEVDDGIRAVDMGRAGLPDRQLGSARGERRGGGDTALRRVAPREVVHAADREAGVQQRAGQAAADEPKSAGHEYVHELGHPNIARPPPGRWHHARHEHRDRSRPAACAVGRGAPDPRGGARDLRQLPRGLRAPASTPPASRPRSCGTRWPRRAISA